MRKLMLLAGVTALTASIPVLATDADGRGRGGGQGRGQAAKAEHQGGGHARAERGRGQDNRGQGQANRGRGQGQQADRGQRRGGEGRVDRQERRAERAVEQERRRDARVDSRGRRVGDRLVIQDRRDWRVWSERRMALRDRFEDDLVRFQESRGRRLAIGPAGCPPGLARHNVFCMPPGQLRKAQLIGQRLPLFNLGYNVPDRYRYRFMDDDRFVYRYGNDGVVYRFDRATGLVSNAFPLYSAGLLPGEPLPLGYDVYNVPFAYRAMYPDRGDYLYRYDDGAIYRVNRESMLVESIAALLTGGAGGLGGLGVGDTLPLGYDVYNVPLAYRDRYYDTNDYMYRYADGYVYQVDPQTRLIQSVISLLV